MSVPIAIIDYRAPHKAKDRLRDDFEVFEFNNPHTYEALRGHPDICLFQGKSGLVLTPNSPSELIALLHTRGIPYVMGTTPIAQDIRLSALYNCVETEMHIIHKQGYTDDSIAHTCFHKSIVNVPQAYTRCSLLYVENMHCITSDKGIEKQMGAHGYQVLYINPQGILLPPYTYGCIGGCFGIHNTTVYCIGSLSQHIEGDVMCNFFTQLDYSVVELYDGPLYDGGGLFFLDIAHD